MADRGLWCVRGGEEVLGGYERRVWVMVVVGGGDCYETDPSSKRLARRSFTDSSESRPFASSDGITELQPCNNNYIPVL